MTPELLQREYREMRMERSLYQRCSRCGTEEVAGAYCTWCRIAEYDLVVHTHGGNACPLGPYLNPSGHPAANHLRRLVRDLARWRLAEPGPAQERFTYHHRASAPLAQWPAVPDGFVA